MVFSTQRCRVWIAGQSVEYWEDPQCGFGSSAEYVQQYAQTGNWVLLFNALVIAANVSRAESVLPS